MPTLHRLLKEQTIATDLETAWNFIRKPSNINKITPDTLDFSIISDVPDIMYDGLLIEYKIGMPLVGRRTWLTEIKNIRDRHSFVDEQRIGPYKLWLHYHEITEVAGGIRFKDEVHYTMPCGIIGDLVHSLYVKDQVNMIFDYREKVLPKVLAE